MSTRTLQLTIAGNGYEARVELDQRIKLIDSGSRETPPDWLVQDLQLRINDRIVPNFWRYARLVNAVIDNGRPM